jgi:hypothetical protein
VTVTITDATPTAVATQIGSGQFTAATLSSGKVTLSLPSGTTNFAVAFDGPSVSLEDGNGNIVQQTIEQVYEASTSDGTSFSFSCGGILPVTTGTLTGSVDASAIPGASILGLFVVEGSQDSFWGAGFTSPFSIAFPAGTDRVEVLEYEAPFLNSDGSYTSYNLLAAKNFSGQVVPGALNGGNAVILGAADQVTEEGITYSGVPSGFSAPSTTVSYMIGDFNATIGYEESDQYPAMPAGATESGDYYSFLSLSTNTANSEVAVYKNSTTAGPLSIAFPAAWTYAGPTPAALPVFDFAYSGFSGNAGIIDSAILTWPLSGATQSELQVFATGNFLNGSTTLAVPNFSGMTGFLAAPASATQVSWLATIDQGPYSSLQPIPANSTTTTVSNSGTCTVP